MKKGFFFLALVSLIACNFNKEAKVQSMSTKDSTTAETIKYPPTDNSVKFEIADPSVTANMLEVYKGWEDNNHALMRKHMADTVMFVGSDGTVSYGQADTIVAQWQPIRNSFATMKPNFHSFVSLKSLDKDETWFLMWYKEYQTDRKGKTDTAELMESWRLNKDGKVTNMYQYLQSNPVPAKK